MGFEQLAGFLHCSSPGMSCAFRISYVFSARVSTREECFPEKGDFSCRSRDKHNAGFILAVQVWGLFQVFWGGFGCSGIVLVSFEELWQAYVGKDTRIN